MWLVVITIVLALIIGLVVWEEFIKPRKENYTVLWKLQADMDRRVQKLEDK